MNAKGKRRFTIRPPDFGWGRGVASVNARHAVHALLSVNKT